MIKIMHSKKVLFVYNYNLEFPGTATDMYTHYIFNLSLTSFRVK